MLSSGAVAVLAMGGTIDKDYVVETASLEVADPFAGWIEPELRLNYGLAVTQLARKDSVDLAEADRDRLVAYLTANKDTRLLVTHGTDTLMQTAADVRAGQRAGAIAGDKTIVFTGAFRPGRFLRAEAVFNLGYGLAVAQTAPPGVYVAIAGQFAPVEDVRHADGRFVYA